MEAEFPCRGDTHIVELGDSTAEIWGLHDFWALVDEFHEIEKGLGETFSEFPPGGRLGYEIGHVGVDLRH